MFDESGVESPLGHDMSRLDSDVRSHNHPRQSHSTRVPRPGKVSGPDVGVNEICSPGASEGPLTPLYRYVDDILNPLRRNIFTCTLNFNRFIT